MRPNLAARVRQPEVVGIMKIRAVASKQGRLFRTSRGFYNRTASIGSTRIRVSAIAWIPST